MKYIPLQVEKRREAMRYLSFIGFILLLVVVVSIVYYLRISPLLAGLCVFTIAIWFMMGEAIPEEYERYKPMFYLLGLGLLLTLWGLALKGYIPLAIPYTAHTYSELLAVTLLESLVIAGVLSTLIALTVIYFLKSKRMKTLSISKPRAY